MSKISTLRDKYPKILGEGAGYRGHGCELSVGDGWFDLLDKLCTKLQALSDATGEQIVAAQVKEKFGGLRFYLHNHSPEADIFIAQAEQKAAITCEECGAPGVARTDGWIKTLCDRHATERKG